MPGRTRSRPTSADSGHANQMGFAPRTPSHWPVKPDTVAQALDSILASGGGILVTAAAVISDLVIPVGDGGARGIKEALSGEVALLPNGVGLSINPGGTKTQPLRARTSGAGNSIKELRLARCSNTSGAGGTGLGLFDRVQLENDADSLVDATKIEHVWEDASSGAEDASTRHQVAVGGALTEIFRIDENGLLVSSTRKYRVRDDTIFMHSPSDGSLVVESDGSALFRGLTSTTIGVLGDLLMGGATPTVWYPAIDAQVSIGRDANRIDDVFLSGDLDTEGDILFAGSGKGLTFGDLSVKDNTNTLTLNSAAKVQVAGTIFTTNGPSNNTSPDQTQGHITIDKAGFYFIVVAATIQNTAGAGHVVDLSAWINNGATELENVHGHRTLGAGTEVGAIPASGIADLAVNDTVEVWLDTSSGVNRTVIVEDITLTILQLAGT